MHDIKPESCMILIDVYAEDCEFLKNVGATYETYVLACRRNMYMHACYVYLCLQIVHEETQLSSTE